MAARFILVAVVAAHLRDGLAKRSLNHEAENVLSHGQREGRRWIEAVTEAALHKKPYPPKIVQILRSFSGFQGNSSDADARNTVLVTMANMRELPLLQNFLCSASTMRIKAVVFALDREFADNAASNGVEAPVIWDGWENGIIRKTDIGGANAGDSNFNSATFTKVQMIGRILRSGINVFYSDADITYLKDPVPQIFPTSADFRAAQLQMGGSGPEGPFNTGQMFFRAGPRAEYMIDAWIQAMLTEEQFGQNSVPTKSDQDVFNGLLTKHSRDSRAHAHAKLLGLLSDRNFNSESPLWNTSLGRPLISPLDHTSFLLNNYNTHAETWDEYTSDVGSKSAVSFHVDAVGSTAKGDYKKIDRMKKLGCWVADRCHGHYGIGVSQEHTSLLQRETSSEVLSSGFE